MNASRNSVKTRFTATHFTLTPHDYGQFALSVGKKSYLHILLIHPLKTDTLLIRRLSIPLSVCIKEVCRQ